MLYCVLVIYGEMGPIPSIYGPFEDTDTCNEFMNRTHQEATVRVDSYGPLTIQAINETSVLSLLMAIKQD